jgi:hypothetical protein
LTKFGVRWGIYINVVAVELEIALIDKKFKIGKVEAKALQLRRIREVLKRSYLRLKAFSELFKLHSDQGLS